MATQFGVTSTFGLTFQAGVITESISDAFSHTEKQIFDGGGEVTGETMYREVCESTISGYIPITTPFDVAIGGVITLTTVPLSFLQGAVVADSLVKGVTVTQSNEDYQRIEITARQYPSLDLTP